MSSSMSDKKSCKVLAVDPSGPVRQMMADTLRSALGFELAEGRSSVTEALQHLEVDRADWIILPLSGDQTVNAMHLLKVCTEFPPLRKTRISIFVQEDETYVLPTAFSLGLLSWHTRPFTKDTFGEELKTLLMRLEKDGFREPITSAHYLRIFLRASKQYELQLRLEKALLDVYPGDPAILMQMAEPQFHTGKKDSAKTTLLQVKLLDGNKANEVDEIAKNLFSEPLPPNATDLPTGQNVLGLSSAYIIDSDDSVRAGVKDILSKLGITSITDFSDGESAWDFISKNPEPSLIVMEWKIPRLSGPMLLQRIRQLGFNDVPILLISSLISADDMPLVREISISNVVRKPLRKEEFLPTLIWTVQQERMPTEHQTMERKIRTAIKSGQKDMYNEIFSRFIQDPNVPPAKKKLLEAEIAYAANNYTASRDLAIESLKMSGDSIIVLNLLGKAFMRLRDYVSAHKCFEKAQKISPLNLERLCNIAEVKTELGDTESASLAIEKAKNLDPDAQIVKEAEVRVALAAGDTSSAKDLMKQIDALDGLISYMNNKAVAHAKVGHASDAIDIYQKTALSIPDDQIDLIAIVNYNMALALIKANELDKARELLEKSSKIPQNKVSKKIKSLHDRISLALKRGSEFKLKSNEESDTKANSTANTGEDISQEDQHKAMLHSAMANKGDICCHLIFSGPEKVNARTEQLLAKPPRFQIRAAIERDETLGSDKVISKESA